MARPVTARPPAEHIAVLARMLRQIDEVHVTKAVDQRRRDRVRKGLIMAMRALQEKTTPKKRTTKREPTIGFY